MSENPSPVVERTQSARKVSPELSRWPSSFVDDQEKLSSQRYLEYQREQISSNDGDRSLSDRSDYISVDKISRVISTVVPDFYEVTKGKSCF